MKENQDTSEKKKVLLVATIGNRDVQVVREEYNKIKNTDFKFFLDNFLDKEKSPPKHFVIDNKKYRKFFDELDKNKEYFDNFHEIMELPIIDNRDTNSDGKFNSVIDYIIDETPKCKIYLTLVLSDQGETNNDKNKQDTIGTIQIISKYLNNRYSGFFTAVDSINPTINHLTIKSLDDKDEIVKELIYQQYLIPRHDFRIIYILSRAGAQDIITATETVIGEVYPNVLSLDKKQGKPVHESKYISTNLSKVFYHARLNALTQVFARNESHINGSHVIPDIINCNRHYLI